MSTVLTECVPEFRRVATGIEGLLVIESKLFTDRRGRFMELYRKSDFTEIGIDVNFVQENLSQSKKNVLRGLHFQRKRPQAKLVRAIRGSVFDVAVDLRRGSRTFGHWHGVTLDSSSKTQFFVPAGFAHGFLALSDDTELAYKCSEYYDPGDEGGLCWDDPDVGIEWPLDTVGPPFLSAKDESWPRLSDLVLAL